MLPDEALKSMKVMFATPCYISAVSMHYVTSIFELTHHCNRFGLECILHMHSESLITRSRNKMVLKFLSDETLTHLFWIDSDITFTPQSVCRLLLIDRDVTAGVYPMKNFNWPPEGLPARAREIRRRTSREGASNVFVSLDGEVAGALVLEDPIRPDTPRVIRTLRRAGIKRVVMVTGDHADVAESVGIAIGVDRILSERDPTDKVDAVKAEGESGVTIMVGDGVNDAPALAAADIGVAMGARGATASSEAADVVLVIDRLDRMAEAIRIARRSRGIAVQS